MKLIVRCLICFPKQLLPPARQDSRQKLAPISLAISARLCFSPGVIRTVNHSVVETRSMLASDGGRCFQVRVETILKSLGSVVRSSVLADCQSRVSCFLPLIRSMSPPLSSRCSNIYDLCWAFLDWVLLEEWSNWNLPD